MKNLQKHQATGNILHAHDELGYVPIKKSGPDEVRTEASLQGMTQIEAYDGKEGWKVSPFSDAKILTHVCR